MNGDSKPRAGMMINGHHLHRHSTSEYHHGTRHHVSFHGHHHQQHGARSGHTPQLFRQLSAPECGGMSMAHAECAEQNPVTKRLNKMKKLFSIRKRFFSGSEKTPPEPPPVRNSLYSQIWTIDHDIM